MELQPVENWTLVLDFTNSAPVVAAAKIGGNSYRVRLDDGMEILLQDNAFICIDAQLQDRFEMDGEANPYSELLRLDHFVKNTPVKTGLSYELALVTNYGPEEETFKLDANIVTLYGPDVTYSEDDLYFCNLPDRAMNDLDDEEADNYFVYILDQRNELLKKCGLPAKAGNPYRRILVSTAA